MSNTTVTKKYTIKEASEQTGLPEETIRYYERINLLPQAKRRENSHRYYEAADLDAMKIIACLKTVGMSLEEIKPFLNVSFNKIPSDYPELYTLMGEYKKKIHEQIEHLNEVLRLIDEKMQAKFFSETNY